MARPVQEVAAFFRTGGLSGAPCSTRDVGSCALGCLPQECRELAETQPRIQAGRVRGQATRRRTCRFNRFLDAGEFAHWQIDRDNELSGLECRNKAQIYIGKKHRRGHRMLAQACHKRDRLPMAVRSVVNQTRASRTSAAQPHHRGAGAGFAYEDHSFRVACAPLSNPSWAGAGHVRALFLRRVRWVFLKVTPWRL